MPIKRIPNNTWNDTLIRSAKITLRRFLTEFEVENTEIAVTDKNKYRFDANELIEEKIKRHFDGYHQNKCRD